MFSQTFQQSSDAFCRVKVAQFKIGEFEALLGFGQSLHVINSVEIKFKNGKIVKNLLQLHGNVQIVEEIAAKHEGILGRVNAVDPTF